MPDAEAILKRAETVVGLLEQHGIEAVFIGSVALAAYRYVRQTEDLDLGVNADITTLRTVAEELRQAGFTVELREPDMAELRGQCARYRLPGLDALIAEAYKPRR